jgi:adhesin transport system outer membrane protein
VKRHKAYVDTIKRRYEQGVSSKVDLDLSELRLAQIQQQLTDSELRFRISNTKLLELSGFSEVSIGKDISDKLFENKLELNAINLNSNNNDVKLKMASAELELSKLESKYAGLEAYPNLVMQYSNDQLYGERFGFQLRAQSGSGLSLLSKYKSATLKNDVKEYNIQKIERDIENENMVKYQTYIHYVIRNSRTSDINDFSFSITESYIRQFVAGKKSWLEVMNSERDLVSSQLDAVENFSSAAEIFSIFELSLSGYASQFLRELHE